MANIIINVDELICEDSIVTNSSWSGIRYVFNVDWTSKGDEYSIFDPTTNLQLSIEIRETIPNTIVYSGVIDNSAPFDATGYQFNVLDYYTGFSGKYTLILILDLTSNAACNEQTRYTFPIDYP
jgi:hypothetical protein